jgi:uncharacterized phage protein (predicted DNA packaging)
MAIVTPAELKAHLNITTPDDDALLAEYLEAAEGWIEIFLGATYSDPVPAPIKQAIKLLAGSFYEHREDVLVGISAESIPFGVHDLIAPYRSFVF